MLEIKKLNKGFKNKKVLTNFNYQFDKSVYGLLAPNGAGKTTLLRCITQIYPEGRKSVFYNGEQLGKIKEINKRIGYLPQQFGLFKELSVFDAMSLLASFKGMTKQESRNEIIKCIDIVNLSDSLSTKVGALSGGMLRRVGIAAALLGDPEVLLLDEPTAGLDPEERVRFKNIISAIKSNKIIVLSTHIVEDVEALCDSIIIMKDGEIVLSGTCDTIRETAGGKVYLVPGDELPSNADDYRVLGQTTVNGKAFTRILSKKTKEEYSALPTVEDGYICAMENF